MMLRNLSAVAAAALVCASPVFAQPADDAQVDLESVDALLGGDEVSSGGEAPGSGSPLPTEDTQPEEAAVEETPEEPAPAPEDAQQPSDLDRAYVAYAQCTDGAAEALREAGEAAEVVGVRALLRCANERAAYVNAFYFMLIPGSPGLEEALVRANAERLAAQTDTFLLAQINGTGAAPDDAAEEAAE